MERLQGVKRTKYAGEAVNLVCSKEDLVREMVVGSETENLQIQSINTPYPSVAKVSRGFRDSTDGDCIILAVPIVMCSQL